MSARHLQLLFFLVILIVCVYAGGRRHGGNCGNRNKNVCCDYVRKNFTIRVRYRVRCNQTETAATTTLAPSSNDNNDDDDSSSNENDDSQEESNRRRRRRCFAYKTYNISWVECHKRCCDGWRMDSNGHCTIKVDDDEEPMVCLNGGTVDDENKKCICSAEFTGKQCETPVCSSKCRNGTSVCTAKNNKAICVCNSGFTGQYCETPVCEKGCLNGGTCINDGFVATCLCASGYTGESCENVVKPGQCPSEHEVYKTKGKGLFECKNDGDCSGSNKCCPSTYGSYCVHPGNMTCKMGNRHYTIGQVALADGCTSCTCVKPSVYHMDPNPLAEFDCYKRDCPKISCSNTGPQRMDACCQVCPDEDGNINPAPRFTNKCPEEEVHLSVSPRGNEIDVASVLSSRFEAKDHKGQVLKVSFSKTILKSCACNYTEFDYHHLTVMSEPDQHGQRAVCFFSVKVIDVHAPVLTGCSSAIYAYVDEKISWDQPTVWDNVGVKETKLYSRYMNDSYFPQGRHVVEYRTVDFHNNIAVCNIPVSVYSRDEVDSSMPLDLKQSFQEYRRKQYMHYGLAAGGGLLILVLTVILAMYVLKKKRVVQRHSSETTKEVPPPVTGFDNNVYTMYPPSYDNAVNELPEKKEHFDEPPVYEELDVKKLPPNEGVDNPVYAEDVVIKTE